MSAAVALGALAVALVAFWLAARERGLRMVERTLTATSMAFRDQRRRPLVLILLVVVPAYVITRSIAETLATPRRIGLPGRRLGDDHDEGPPRRRYGRHW